MRRDIGGLEGALLRMSGSTAPEFWSAVAELARTGRFACLGDVLPGVVYEGRRAGRRKDSEGFVRRWKRLGEGMGQGLIEQARQGLTSLGRGQPWDGDGTVAWTEIERALDGEGEELLRAALAMELLELMEPAVVRATHLRECVTRSSEQADRYLDEATRCYFFGLFAACATMCRAVLEKAIRRRLPQTLAREVRTRYGNAPTLGNLLLEVNKNLEMVGLNPSFPQIAKRVNDVCKRGVEQGVLPEDEARGCLEDTHCALELLLAREHPSVASA